MASRHVRRHRGRLTVALLATASLIAAACGSDDDSSGNTTEAPTAPTSDESATTDASAASDGAASGGDIEAERDVGTVVLVANQDAGDEGPIDGMIEGLEASATTYGFETQFVAAPDPATHETTLRNLAESGADVVITTFFDLASTVELVAPDFPDTTFLTVVAAPSEQPNVNTVDYEFYKGAYVGGRFAAAMTETDKLAYIGGAPLPFAWADFNAFTAGAQDINPDIETTATFAPGGFTDAPGGRELAASLYADGNDFIFTGAAETDLGVVEAAVENDGMVMVSSDLADRGPENVAIIVLIEWADTIQAELDNIIQGGELGRFRLANPESGEISFEVPASFLDGASGARSAAAEAAIADFEATVASIQSGEIVVEQISEEQ